ncbi:hypothetical protein PLESTB_001001000 [Pleodorina starrii]|uniref:Uncharacterized protein n=1 Tax=Pleodorina starrii TaxID=330485 RepID=A0A9W6BPJ8_9CHLO|nr:hypothetical protein PLESTB_001001000 [Pleodorina starrii]
MNNDTIPAAVSAMPPPPRSRSGSARHGPGSLAASTPPAGAEPSLGPRAGSGNAGGGALLLPQLSALDPASRLRIYSLYSDALVERSAQWHQQGRGQGQGHTPVQAAGSADAAAGSAAAAATVAAAAAAVSALPPSELFAVMTGQLEWEVLLGDVGSAGEDGGTAVLPATSPDAAGGFAEGVSQGSRQVVPMGGSDAAAAGLAAEGRTAAGGRGSTAGGAGGLLAAGEQLAEPAGVLASARGGAAAAGSVA